jgi:AcrR family transcriptional regulator
MNVNSLIEDKFTNSPSVSSLSRRQRDRLLRRADILRAAEHVFALKGYYEATMQDIAKEAQYATGTVYLYFKDKDSLYISLFEQKHKDLLSLLKEETTKEQDSRKKIEVFIIEELSFFERNQDFFRIFALERSRFQVMKALRDSRSSVITQYREFINELIKGGQSQKVLRDDFDSAQIADVFMSVLMAVVFEWFKGEPKRRGDLRQKLGFILEMFLKGAERK